MKTYVQFRSKEFPPYVEEKDEINPGRYGKRLAEYLSAGLQKMGFEPLESFTEDWGVVLPIKNDDFSLWIGCGNDEEYPDNGFLCFIEPHQPLIRRFGFLWKVDTTPKVIALQEAIDHLLATDPHIWSVKWWTHEEFNHPIDSRKPTE